MRKVLFRGKRTDNGKWVYGSFIQLPDNNEIGYIAVFEEDEAGFVFADNIEVNLNTVGQYTGFRDKNGVKIFEGDICDHVYQAYPRRFFNRGIIFYDEEHARFAHMLQSMNPELGRITTDAWEVVGNIHDTQSYCGERNSYCGGSEC